MSTKPRGYKSAELPPDPASLLRTLRLCCNGMQAASKEVNIHCELQKVGRDLTKAIDAVAGLLTGDPEYFWFKGSGPTDQQRAEEARWRAIERGELPWPR